MTEAKQTVRITDTSLRDGSHAMSHQFTAEQVREVSSALDKAGVQVAEVVAAALAGDLAGRWSRAGRPVLGFWGGSRGARRCR